MNDDDQDLCVVCRRQPPEHGFVCEPDRDRIAEQLHGLIGQVQRLEVEVTPGARRGDGVRVSTSKGAAPLPARLDALSLVGPGSGSVTAMLHPQVRHWQTTREADVTAVKRTLVQRVPGGPLVPHAEVVTERRTITEWHQDLARDDAGGVLVLADDDQIGTIPPREWLTLWVAALRDVFRYRVATRTRPVAWQHKHRPGSEPGSEPGSDDPLADDVTARFGTASTSTAVAGAVMLLLIWLDDACDEPDVPIGDFAGELRSLSAELARVLGERPDQMWLGRCPARITDPDTGAAAPCGAGIWQDPHASQVQCPRCHSTWGPRRVQLLELATEMRRTWPVDRRRLYTAEESRTVRRPRCPTCGGLADITWRDVTGTGDRVQVFQPVGASCPAGCDEAKQVI